MGNVLCICEGNRHRSYMAKKMIQAAIAKIPKERGLESRLVIDSAGLVEPHEVYGANEDVIKALEDLGYEHDEEPRPKKANAGILMKQDLILCFESSHVDRIKKIAPELTARVTTLSEYAAGIYEEIESPEERMGRTIWYSLMNSLNVPLSKRVWVYNNLRGITDERDFLGRVALFKETGRQIQKYIDGAVQQMIKDGLLFDKLVI